MTPAFTYAATVEKVVDADTLDVAIDLGFRVQFRVRVRIGHVDAAERNTPLGTEAVAWLRQTINRADYRCVITTSKPDKFGRALADVQIGDIDLATELIRLGYGVPYEGGPRG